MAREAARCVALDAGRHLERNWSEAGTERLAALFRLAEHIGRSEMPTPSLLAVSIFETAARYTALFQDKFSEEDRRTLAEALARFPAEGTFRFVAGVRNDAAVSAQRLANRIRSRQMDDWSLEDTGLDGVLASVKADSENAMANTRTAGLAPARLIRDAMRIAEIGEKYTEGWGDPAAIEALLQDLKSGEYGIFAWSFTVMYSKLVKVDFDARAKLNALRAWATGETDTLKLPE